MKTEPQREDTLVIVVKRNTLSLSKNRQLCQKTDKNRVKNQKIGAEQAE
jgi:hypothetical protein